MLYFFILLCGLLFAVLLHVARVNEQKQKYDFFKEKVYRFQKTKQYSFDVLEFDQKSIWAMGVDVSKEKIVLFAVDSSLHHAEFHYSEIADISLITSLTIKPQGAGDRALVGGLIGGTAGAVIGASTAHHVTETQIKGVRLITSIPTASSFEIIADAKFCQFIYDTVFSAITSYRQKQEQKRLTLQQEQLKLEIKREGLANQSTERLPRRSRMERYHGLEERK